MIASAMPTIRTSCSSSPPKLLYGLRHETPILQVATWTSPCATTRFSGLSAVPTTLRRQEDHGLIVDYLRCVRRCGEGALEFDEKGFRSVVGNIEGLQGPAPEAMKCFAFLLASSRHRPGYEGLMGGTVSTGEQRCKCRVRRRVPVLGKLWEAISPDPMLLPFEVDYRRLTRCTSLSRRRAARASSCGTRSARRPSELIHQNVHVDAVRDDLADLVLDASCSMRSSAHPTRRSAPRSSRSGSLRACASTWATLAQGAVRTPRGARGATRAG